jgi:hypothetical protein
MKKTLSQRVVAWCTFLLGTGLAVVAVLYLVDGNTDDAVSYGTSLVALAVAYTAWHWAQGRPARSKKSTVSRRFMI